MSKLIVLVILNAVLDKLNMGEIAVTAAAQCSEIAAVLALGTDGTAKIMRQAITANHAALAEEQFNAIALAAYQLQAITASHAAHAEEQ